MSPLTFLYLIFIGPLKLLFEVLFSVALRCVDNPGWAVVVLSLAVNLLVLPLYNRADTIQRRSRELKASMSDGIARVRKAFKGDERVMMLQAFYRENDYSPVKSLNSAVPLLLQIPFFIAAYDMLSNLSCLKGVKFFLIDDLSKPDGILVIGGLAVNILPILMTVINLLSGAIYNRNFTLKDKMQTVLIAAVFLILLYNSPAGLVFYWTLNNVFSLVKNIVTFIPKRKGRAGHGLPVLSKLWSKVPAASRGGRFGFTLAGIVLSLFIGLYIPSTIVSNSPLEFLDPILYDNPIKYVLYSFAPAIGIFIVWGLIIYHLASPRIKTLLEAVWGGLVFFTMYSNFAYDGAIGIINPNMAYYYGFNAVFTLMQKVTDILVLVFVLVFSYLFIVFKRRYLTLILTVFLIIDIAIPVMECRNIFEKYNGFEVPSKIGMNIDLSRDGRNVVVIMLDRGCGFLIDDIFEQDEDMREEFDGFTFYPNTVSYGMHTYLSTPSVFGGYEYTPDRINRRTGESLISKHNEALSVLPVLFRDNGYTVDVIDPPDLGYQEIPKTSVLDSLDGIDCYYTGAAFTDENISLNAVRARERNLFFFSIYLTSPLCLRDFIYDGGRFNNPESEQFVNQSPETALTASGIAYTTVTSYDTMSSMIENTTVNESGDCLVVFQNLLTHEPALFDTETWTPQSVVNNTDDIFAQMADGDIVKTTYYHSAYASLLLLSDWFDYLRENGLYDNTRIIIVSDHGYCMNPDGIESIDDLADSYNALMLYKDFGSHGFNVSDELMTTAETAYFAVNGLIEDPVNPFTGNVISNEERLDGQVMLSYADHEYIQRIGEDRDAFSPNGGWYVVQGNDIRDASNWGHISQTDEQ